MTEQDGPGYAERMFPVEIVTVDTRSPLLKRREG